jgi:TMEM175 potassium channel family protein
VTDDATSGSGNDPGRREEAPDQSPLHKRGEFAAPDGPPAGAGPAGESPAGGRHAPGRHLGSGLYPIARSGFIEYDRILFFSDAVMAIAVTLLAVDLRVPMSAIRTADLLKKDINSLVGFAISFAVIGLFWLGHHGMFRYITGFDRALIGLNLLFLGTIAFLPYPTDVLSRAAGDRGAVIFYASCAAAAGIAEAAIWLYATRRGSGLADPSVAPVRLQTTLRVVRIPAVFLASIPVAIVAPTVAQYMWILILVLGIAINRLVPRFAGSKEAGSSAL